MNTWAFRLAAVALCSALAAVAQAEEVPWQEKSDGIAVRTSGGLSEQWTQRRYDPRDLWALEPLQPAAPPAGSAHPVDAFIDARLRQAGLQTAPRADRLTLIRRATFDLTGLPPTPAEIEAFVDDDAPEAFPRLIERLLSSPHYGQRMAQHWLDVTRYADTAGFSNDFERPNAWRYRDYVIRSFNADKPYDRFILEQIAGDELDESDPELLIAVGYLRMGPWEHTAMSVAAETRQQYLDDVTHAVGETFLGLGLRCARCHDHKFDPIPTADYYAMQAVFAAVQFADRSATFGKRENTSSFDAGRARSQRLLDEARAQLRDIRRKEERAIEAWLKERGMSMSVRQARALPEDQRPPRHLGLSNEDLGIQKVWQKRIELLQRQMMSYEPLAMSVYSGPPRTVNSGNRHALPADRSGDPQPVHILLGGSLHSPGQAVGPGAISAACTLGDLPGPEFPAGAAGRRLALARWTADRRNPLTARVMVNRIWQWHFGRALAANPNNLGYAGRKPTHPELLDWLAAEFIRAGWSVKHIHRLIMTSQAYQRAAWHPSIQAAQTADPSNDLLAHFPVRRLTAEELRDAMLSASGELNLEMGGPPIYPEINAEVALQPRHIMGSVAPAYQPSPTPDQRHRRTIYAVRIRTLRDPMLEIFDQPGPDLSCERRESSTIVPQAFALMNGTNTHDRALAMAARIERQATATEVQIHLAFIMALGRGPSEEEVRRCQSHLDAMTEYHRGHEPARIDPPTAVVREMVEEMTGLAFTWTEELDLAAVHVPDLKPWDVEPRTRALADLCLVLFNSNEFAYVY